MAPEPHLSAPAGEQPTPGIRRSWIWLWTCCFCGHGKVAKNLYQCPECGTPRCPSCQYEKMIL
ncbi:hypothetical protein F4781DRAFT_395549 [Annulohypoxylon bovei var. microspora]|nr:hypothetical protein F4781DRAFT_395549 [Annulohypoxylon bovei var. microspora]